MPIGAAAIIGGGSVLGGLMGSRAAEKGAAEQAAASRYAADVQKQMFDVQNEQQKPYREIGYSSLKDIAGMKDYLQHRYTAEDFQQSMDPGYAWRLAQGQRLAAQQANAAGGSIGGNALAGLQDYTQGQASQEFGNAFNRYQTERGNIYNTLASIAGLGQTSLGQTGQMSTQTAANIGQAIQNAGSAQAAGTIGSANALAGGIQGAGNAYYMSQLLKPTSSPMATPAGYGTPVASPEFSAA